MMLDSFRLANKWRCREGGPEGAWRLQIPTTSPVHSASTPAQGPLPVTCLLGVLGGRLQILKPKAGLWEVTAGGQKSHWPQA